MVVHEVISAGCCDGLQLMVRKLAAEMLPGSRQGVVELVVGVVHPIYLEDCLETSFVETGVVRNEGEALDERFNLLPDIGEHRSVIRVLRTQTVDLLAEPLVVFRLGMYEAVERVHDFPAAKMYAVVQDWVFPTEHTLDGCSFAVSKSIAAKSLIIYNLSSSSSLKYGHS